MDGVDWECAQSGDAAYDLAIVTRGVRRPLRVANGLQRLTSTNGIPEDCGKGCEEPTPVYPGLKKQSRDASPTLITALRRPFTPPALGKDREERELTGGNPAKGITPKKPEDNGRAWRRSRQSESRDGSIGNLHPALLGFSTSANMEA